MASPFPRLTTPQFFAPVKILRIFPYRAQKNVSYLERYAKLGNGCYILVFTVK